MDPLNCGAVVVVVVVVVMIMVSSVRRWSNGSQYDLDQARLKFQPGLFITGQLLSTISISIADTAPGKMTIRNAQLIEKLFFGWYSIGYLMRDTMKSWNQRVD
jgi:hypothetical protein